MDQLPNVFVGRPPRKHRAAKVLEGSSCRVVVLWQEPAPIASALRQAGAAVEVEAPPG